MFQKLLADIDPGCGYVFVCLLTLVCGLTELLTLGRIPAIPLIGLLEPIVSNGFVGVALILFFSFNALMLVVRESDATNMLSFVFIGMLAFLLAPKIEWSIALVEAVCISYFLIGLFVSFFRWIKFGKDEFQKQKIEKIEFEGSIYNKDKKYQFKKPRAKDHVSVIAASIMSWPAWVIVRFVDLALFDLLNSVLKGTVKMFSKIYDGAMDRIFKE